MACGVFCYPCTLTRNALEVHHREKERKQLGLPPLGAAEPGYAAPQPMLMPLANIDSVLMGVTSPVLTGSPAPQDADTVSLSAPVVTHQARAMPIYPVGKAHKTELSTVMERESTESALSSAARILRVPPVDENHPGRAETSGSEASPRPSEDRLFHPKPHPQTHSLAATVADAENDPTARASSPGVTWWPAREQLTSVDNQPVQELTPVVHDFAHDHPPAKNTPLVARDAVPDDNILPLAPVERGPREHGIEEDSMVPF